MKNWEQRIVATAVALLTLTLAACGGGGSSSGASSGSSSGQSSSIVVSSSRLVLHDQEDALLFARTISRLLIRDALADGHAVIITGEEFGDAGRRFTTNAAGTVIIPVFGGNYTVCVEGVDPMVGCENLTISPDTVLVYNTETKQKDYFPAEDEQVAGEFAVDGQNNKRIVCHKGKRSIQVAHQAVYDAHRAHGDRAGGCGNSTSVNGDDPTPPGNSGQSKVTVCHNGRTTSVPESSLSGHLGHGDTEGPCPV